MEDVWKDLTMTTSLQQAMPSATATSTSSAAAARIAVQDLFLNHRTKPDNDVVERRKKRMIKNRESAARSRARKQAYTDELEKEVAHLQKENMMLNRQAEELKKAMADQPSLAPKSTLQRTLTAPF